MEQTPGTPKGLMAAVIGMGLLIVVGTVALVGVIIHRMGSHTPPSGTAITARAVPLQNAAAPPVLPAGTRLISMARVQDGLMALHIADNGQDRILLWQIGTDHLILGVEGAVHPAGAAP